MIYLDEAVKTRYSATGLTSSVGQIYDHQQPEGSVLPYVSFKNVSDTRLFSTQAPSIYQKAQIEFTVWHTGKLPCGQLCELIQAEFLNGNLDPSNPLAMAVPNAIVNCLLMTPYTITQVSDTIWSGSQTFTVTYRRDGVTYGR